MDKFKNFMQDNNISHISDDRHDKTLKMEVLDCYPQSMEDIKQIPYLQSIEKMNIPDIDLYIIELKGDHIRSTLENSPKEGKRDHNSIKNNKTLSLLNPEIKNALLGRGLLK